MIIIDSKSRLKENVVTPDFRSPRDSTSCAFKVLESDCV